MTLRSELSIIPLILALAATGQSQLPPDVLARNFERTLIFRDRAFQVGDPILVAGPDVVGAKWSWDGAYLLIEQEVGPKTVSDARAALSDPDIRRQRVLTVYDVSAGTSREVFRRDARSFVIEDFEWLRGGEALLHASIFETDATGALAEEPRMVLFRVNPATARAREFSLEGNEGIPFFRLEFAPDGGFALIQALYEGAIRSTEGQEETERSRAFYVIRPDLKLVPIQAPENSRGIVFYFADGKPFAMAAVGGAAGLQRNWYRVDPVNGVLTPAMRPEGISMVRSRPAGVLQTRRTEATVTNGLKATRVRALWLETREPTEPNRLLLAGDGEQGEVAPNVGAVSYVAHGALYVRPVEQISLTAFRELKETYERTMAMKRAREVAMGFLMYGADHEDTFPGSRADYISLIAPYLASTESFGSFLYTFEGGLVTDVRDPSRTQLGYIELASGRVVAFIDGHVEWVPNRSG